MGGASLALVYDKDIAEIVAVLLLLLLLILLLVLLLALWVVALLLLGARMTTLRVVLMRQRLSRRGSGKHLWSQRFQWKCFLFEGKSCCRSF